ncbi:MAG: CpaF family protein [Deltaproteobacteria bacterium]|nr:CpaF family protein [Deltaproteobacteria bacterium]
MSGILKNLHKKNQAGAADASQLLVRPSAAIKQPTRESSQPETEISTTDENIGDTEEVVKQTQHFQPSRLSQTTKLPVRRVRMVKTGVISQNSEKSVLEEDIPAWVGQTSQTTPQLDILVPAGRRTLNDLITEDTTREELPILIEKAIHIASQKMAVSTRFSQRDIDAAIKDLHGLILGKGPLQPLYDDPAVTDIYLDSHKSIKCIRRGKALETPFRFRSTEEYEAYIGSMLQSVERVLNLSSPIVDCVLKDGYRSRVNAVHSSLLDRGESSLVIRIPRLQHITFFDLIKTNTLPPQVAAWLAELVSMGEANILVLGATGSGKTVFTTALLSAVGSDERICTIEDVPEIFVPTAHIEKLVARPENSQGKGKVEMHSLLRAALRRAPHRIVVGEIRDREGPLFLKALETGHLGSVATIHAHNAKDSLWRLLDVVAAYEEAPQESIQRRISRSVNILIAMEKVNGKPCMVDISEVRTPVGGEFIVNQILRFEDEDADGKRRWRLVNRHSEWLDKILERGVDIPIGGTVLPPNPIKEKETE